MADLSIHELIKTHTAAVSRRLRALGVRPAELDDATQEVFLVAHRKLRTFEGRSTVKTWLFAICRKVAADARRRACARYETLSGTLPELAFDADVDTQLDLATARDTLASAVQSVPAPARETFVLFELDERPMREVAQRTGVPLQTAYARLYAARRHIAAALR